MFTGQRKSFVKPLVRQQTLFLSGKLGKQSRSEITCMSFQPNTTFPLNG